MDEAGPGHAAPEASERARRKGRQRKLEGDSRAAWNLKRLRLASGLSQSDVAEALGRDHQSISGVERGRSGLFSGDLISLAALFGVPVEEFFRPIDGQPEPIEVIGGERLAGLFRAFAEIQEVQARQALLSLARALAEGCQNQRLERGLNGTAVGRGAV